MQELVKQTPIDKYGVPILKTPNPDCLACQKKRMHTIDEFAIYHPLAGTGISHDRKLAGG